MDVFKTLILDTPTAEGATGTVTSVDLTAGTGISVSGGPITSSGSITVTNTSPDQTVALTGGTGISTSGTYPNFTITNDAPDQTVALTGGTGISTSGAYPNFTITNDAPDQTVSIAAGTGISTSGSYPSFTVTNSAPDQTVSIASGTGISVTGSYPSFTVTNSSPSLGGDVVGPASSTDNGIVRFDGTTGKLVQDSSSVIIDDSGNVGIGTATPNIGGVVSGNTVLTIAGTSGSRSGIIEMQSPLLTADNTGLGLLRFYNGTNEVSRMEARSEGVVDDAGRLQFYSRATGGALTERMRIDSVGNVGIGTTSPAEKLTIVDSTASSGYIASFTRNSKRMDVYTGTSVDLQIGTPGAHSLGFFTNNNNPSLTITSGGNVTAAPSTGQQILFGSTAGSTTSKAFIGFDQTDKVVGLGITNSSTTRTGYFLYFFNDTGGSNGYINQVNNTTVAYTTTSDVRLKNNIRDFQNSGSIIDAIKPRTFDWNWGGKDATGFIAQELNEVFPEAVSAGDVGDEIDKTWGIDPAKLVPVLVAEIQSLRRRLAALESK